MLSMAFLPCSRSGRRLLTPKKVFGALLTDLSKAFDCLTHDLNIPKLNAYGFSLPVLNLIRNYLANRKQRTKINDSYSPWSNILFGVPQGSILGPLLFNIFLSDLFLIVKDVNIASYADDNTLYDSCDTIEEVILSLQSSSEKLFQWLSDNQMKGNPEKCHLIMSTDQSVNVQLGGSLIERSDCEKMLGVKIDYKLNFDEHVKTLCSKANNKLRALARATPYMSVEKKKILMNSFFNAQFNYCPLIWMLHSRRNNNIIRNLHERCLRLIYNDKNSSYEELITKDGSVSIHHRNIQALVTEFYKFKNGLSPGRFTEVFAREIESHYNLRRCNDFRIPSIRTVYHGSESISFLGPKIWNILPAKIKQPTSLNSFKKSITK